MKFRKRFLLMVAAGAVTAAALSGCGKSEPTPVPTTNALKQPALQVSRFDALRVKELFVVIFTKNYAVHEWKAIFDQTKKLSANKRKLREMEGITDSDVDQIRGDLIAINAELLTEIGNQSLFLMSWSANDENCRLALSDLLRLTCKPINRDNPLNGGLPAPVGSVEWINPNPVTSDTKSPYLRILLARAEAPAYQLELRLKIEREDERETWLKGEALPVKGSEFQDADGMLTQSYFPFGYAEMTLGK